MKEKTKVTIYADGSCTPNPGRGSWAAVIVYSDGSRQEVSGVSGEDRTTNQRMELMAAIAGLEALEFPCSVDLYSDSRYLITGMTTGFSYEIKRIKRGLIPKPRPNADLWQRLNEATQTHEVRWHWIKGHNGNEENERADYLATSCC